MQRRGFLGMLMALPFAGSAFGWLSSLQKADKLFVSSVVGSDDNPGTSDKPFATVRRAIEAAESGGVVFVMAGHHEVVSQTLFMGPDDLTVIGLGESTDRPSFDMSNAVFGNVRGHVSNCRFDFSKPERAS
jgi:hypothetical protein